MRYKTGSYVCDTHGRFDLLVDAPEYDGHKEQPCPECGEPCRWVISAANFNWHTYADGHTQRFSELKDISKYQKAIVQENDLNKRKVLQKEMEKEHPSTKKKPRRKKNG